MTTPNARLTPDEIAHMREWVRVQQQGKHNGQLLSTAGRWIVALLAELDAVTRERDEARRYTQEAIRRLERATDALNMYGIHKHHCAIWLGTAAGCSCGLADAAAGRSSDSAASNADEKQRELERETAIWISRGYDRAAATEIAKSVLARRRAIESDPEFLQREYEDLMRQYAPLYQAWKDGGRVGPPPAHPIKPHMPGRGDA